MWTERLSAAGLPASAKDGKVKLNVSPEQFAAVASTLADLVQAAADQHHV